MSAVPSKVVRKKLVHEAVLDKIDREHLSINTDKVRARLQTNREHVHGNMLRKCLDQWERIIFGVGGHRRLYERGGDVPPAELEPFYCGP